MLKCTFVHIPGIGAKSESRMWRSGMTSVDQLLEEVVGAVDVDALSPRQQKVHRIAHASLRALETGDYGFFYEHLPAREHWRLLGEGLRTAYLDIETTGLDPLYSHITTICIYDGSRWKTYVHGRNLDDFKTDIQQYDLLVTFSGKTFDVPFINSAFDIRLDIPHVDLRYPLAALGYKGGLKRIERMLGLGRKDALAEVDGALAIHLWDAYARGGDPRALDTLLAYNLEDVFSLAPLSARVFNLNLPDRFGHLRLPETIAHPQIPHTVDAGLVARLKARMY